MNDIELVDQVKKGNPSAYRFLVSKYQRLVFSIAFKIVNQNQVEVEDIAQEVFIKIYKNIKSYRKESKLSTWVASITWKTSIDYVRKKKRNKIDFTDDLEVFEGDIISNAYAEIQQTDLKQIIKEIMNKLPEQYQVVLTLFYLEEFSIAEIQEITNMPLGTIKSYLNRARNLFKDKLEDVHGSDAISLLYHEK